MESTGTALSANDGSEAVDVLVDDFRFLLVDEQPSERHRVANLKKCCVSAYRIANHEGANRLTSCVMVTVAPIRMTLPTTSKISLTMPESVRTSDEAAPWDATH